MPRRALVALVLASNATLIGCSKLAELAGAPTVTRMAVHGPSGILVGDSAQMFVDATKSDGTVIPDLQTPDSWQSSDPSTISISSTGVIKGVKVGQATISSTWRGTTGSALVTVGATDARLGYALADQPGAVGAYTPAAATSFNSSGGAITVTHNATGIFIVTFAGLGRPPGGRDNVQVSAVGTSPVYCKAKAWDGSTADLVVNILCVDRTAATVDSKFTIVAIGARAFGATTPLGFMLTSGTETVPVNLDSAVTSYNTAGGHVELGPGSTGGYAAAWAGLGALSGGAAGPVGMMVTAADNTARRCELSSYDLATSGIAVTCRGAAGGLQNAGFSALWFTRGRPGLRYGYALALNTGNTTGYSPTHDISANSSGGPITVKKTATGTYQIVFAGLAHAAATSEGVVVSGFGSGSMYCTLASWGNSGANDLAATVNCWDAFDAPADYQWIILIVQ
jgi:hypothetical protein